MLFSGSIFLRFAILLGVLNSLAACAVHGLPTPTPMALIPKPPPMPGAIILKAPVLSFNDTGLSVSDGITRNGLWAVDSPGIDWEFSLDQGTTWTRGVGTSFEVTGDGAKMI